MTGPMWKGVAVVAVALCAMTPALARASACDRDCLTRMVDGYIDAMVAKDAGRVPLAADVVVVENAKRTGTKEGLWARATGGATAFRIYVPDTSAQQVGYIGVMQADGRPVLLALRLKLQDGRITEAEHLVVWSLREDLLVNLQVPRRAFAVPVPEGYRDSRASLLRIGLTYYDALDENNGSLAPFADDCVRFENGMQTARDTRTAYPMVFGSVGLGCAAQLDTNSFEYITSIDHRRVWIADEETGLAFGLSHFRHAMDKKEYRIRGVPGIESRTIDYAPFDMPAAHIFKIWGGHIHEIEAVGVSAPYRAPTGWER